MVAKLIWIYLLRLQILGYLFDALGYLFDALGNLLG